MSNDRFSQPLSPLAICRAALVLALGICGFLLWRMRFAPPAGFDAFIYQLPLAVEWLQHGIGTTVDFPFHYGISEYGPSLVPLTASLLMRITGDAGLVWLIQPLALMGLCAIYYRICRRSGTGKPAALALTALFMFFPPYLRNAQIFGNDLVLTLGTALVLYACLLFPNHPNPSLLYAGLGGGIMLATKTLGIIHILAAIPSIALSLYAWRERKSSSRLTLFAIVCCVLLLLSGSGFLILNLIRFDNPLYPLPVHLAEMTLFDGPRDLAAFQIMTWHPVLMIRPLLATEGQAWDIIHRFVLLGGWCTCVLGGIVMRSRIRPHLRLPHIIAIVHPVSLLLLHSLLLRGFPGWVHGRYQFATYFSLWIGLACGWGILYRSAAKHHRQYLLWSLLAVICLRLLALPYLAERWFQILFAVSAGIALLPWPRRRITQRVLPAAAALLLVAVLTSPWWYPEYAAERRELRKTVFPGIYGSLGRAWTVLDSLSSPDASRIIAYAGTIHLYPLYGPWLKNRVMYVPVHPDDHDTPCKYQPDIPGQGVPYQRAQHRRVRWDDSFWLEQLRTRKVEFLLLATEPTIAPITPEASMIRRHPECFRLIFREKDVFLFQVFPESDTISP